MQEMQTESFSSKCLCRKCKQKVLAANEKNHGNEEEGRCPSSDFYCLTDLRLSCVLFFPSHEIRTCIYTDQNPDHDQSADEGF